jgi:hypothetical protein
MSTWVLVVKGYIFSRDDDDKIDTVCIGHPLSRGHYIGYIYPPVGYDTYYYSMLQKLSCVYGC